MKTSETTGELFKALAEFQKDVKQPKKDANNPFFKSKYVPLENVIEVIHEAGAKHGLAEMTYPATSEDGTQHGVGVIITHSSGEYIQFPAVLLKPAKNDPQGVGAALTYSRRYALSAAFGIASETDDDGNSISGGKTKTPAKQAPKKNEPAELNQTEQEIMDILNALEDMGENRAAIQKQYLVDEKQANFKNHAKLLGYLKKTLAGKQEQAELKFEYPEAKK
ncbi:ERF family protein [Jeotgalibaca sp. A127]|uniref:ERF family protein n=1 Tax=Jeotgalibaca sp. A127 TaxID=3457324 RepID=UPI003FD4C0AD